MTSQAIVDVRKDIYAWSSRISGTVVLLFVTTTLCIHIKNIRRHIKSTNNSQLSMSLIFSVLLHIFIIIFNIFTVWVTYEKIEDIPRCEVIGHGAGTSYMLAKWTLYMLLSFRIGEVFRGSAFGYSLKLLYGWQSFLTIGVIGNAVLNVFNSKPYINNNLSFLSCDTKVNTIILTYTALFDITACSVNLILFIIPLKKLNDSMAENEQSKSKSKSTSNSTNNHNNNNNNTNNNDVQTPTTNRCVRSASSTMSSGHGYTPGHHHTQGHTHDKTPSQNNSHAQPLSPTIDTVNTLNLQIQSNTSREYDKSIEIVDIPVPVMEDERLENDHDKTGIQNLGSPLSTSTEVVSHAPQTGSLHMQPVQIGSGHNHDQREPSTEKKKKKKKKEKEKRMSNGAKKSKKRKNQKQREEENKLLRVIKKLTLLTAIGVGSTIVNAMLIGIFSVPILWYVLYMICRWLFVCWFGLLECLYIEFDCILIIFDIQRMNILHKTYIG